MASRSCCLLLALLLGLHASGCATETTTIDVHDRVDALETHHRGDVPSFVASDVVIVIDQSSLTLLASGVDVDKDGIVGRNLSTTKHAERTAIPAEQWTTDSDDTVEALELEVARALIPRLASRNNRLGLASFTLRARTEGSSLVRFNDKPLTIVPIGPPEAVLAALANFPSARERRHIDLARLLELAIQILEEAPITEPERPRVILLLSAGEPSAPDGIHWSTQRAIGFVDELVDRRITLWAIPFGFADVAYLPDLTRPTGGDVLALEELDALFGPPASRARSAEHETDG